ncbi:MAG: hypothetical protein J0L64_16510 [Acidobacteria bacterium]|nr:hypothetical protein [Acidobacteriota bacterium]
MALAAAPLARAAGKTEIAIRGEQFVLNGKLTYAGRTFEGMKIEGLLFNSRMIQGIYDDENAETVKLWKYPDTGKWDAERNTREFVGAMAEWRKHGMLGYTIGLQGGSPQGYSKVQPWRNSMFAADGATKPAFRARLQKILDRADELGMVSIVNYFYFGQDEHLNGDAAILRATRETTEWMLKRGYRNVMVDVVNEANNRSYQQPLLKADRVHELVELVKSIQVGGRRLITSTSFNGGTLPPEKVVEVSDYVILHGNGVKDPARITRMVEQVRAMKSWKPKPVLFNEDDHFDFDKPANNMRSATAAYASWGYFDPGASDYMDGYQCPPVNWGLSSERKREFFAAVKKYTGF